MKQDLKLGKGLSELLGASYETTITKTENSVEEINIYQITAGRYQPRTEFTPEDLRDLASSIREKGVIQPILVKYNNNNRKYEIIAGERRWRASQIAGKKSLPALVLDIDDKEAYELAIIENIQREKLSPMDEAASINQLINKYDYTQEDIAEKLGKSRTYVANMVRLLDLPAEIQNMVKEKKLSAGHARALIKKENSIAIANKIISEGLSVRETEDLIRKQNRKEQKQIVAGHDNQKQKYLDEMAEKISDQTHYNVKISHNGKVGKLTFEFKNIQELKSLAEYFHIDVSRETY